MKLSSMFPVTHRSVKGVTASGMRAISPHFASVITERMAAIEAFHASVAANQHH